jgi:hypothetical protein
VHKTAKCKLSVCVCLVTPDDAYCSDYCRQASSQGAERDFCQCAHSGCSKPALSAGTIDATGLPGSISFAPGSVTIEYSDNRDLRDQLFFLMQRLDAGVEAETHSRLPASLAPSKKMAARAASG